MIAPLIPPIVFAALLTTLVGFAVFTDIRSYKITNLTNGIILLLFPIAAAFADNTTIHLLNSGLAFLVLFVVGYVLFACGITGGGDVKLLSVLALWVGWGETLLHFVLLTTVLGGLLTLLLLFSRIAAPAIILKIAGEKGKIPLVLTQGQPVPYGVAIGAAFLWLLWTEQLPIYAG